MKVVAAILIQNGRVLVGRRPKDKSYSGLWEFPGGKVKTGESLEQALDRELQEELKIPPQQIQFSCLGDVEKAPIHLTFFVGHLDLPYSPQEHPAVAWITPEKQKNIELCPADSQALEAFSAAITAQIQNKRV